MSETGPPPNPLAERMREREKHEDEQYAAYRRRGEHRMKRELRKLAATAAEEQRQIAEEAAMRQRELAEISRQSFNDELARIEKSYRRRTAALSKHGLTVAIVGTLVGLAIYGGVWGLAQWSANDLRSDLDTLRQQIARQTEILENLTTHAWGVELVEGREGQRYVLLPPGTELLARPVNGRTAAVVPPATPPVE